MTIFAIEWSSPLLFMTGQALHVIGIFEPEFFFTFGTISMGVTFAARGRFFDVTRVVMAIATFIRHFSVEFMLKDNGPIYLNHVSKSHLLGEPRRQTLLVFGLE